VENGAEFIRNSDEHNSEFVKQDFDLDQILRLCKRLERLSESSESATPLSSSIDRNEKVNIAILDETGLIVSVNQSWRDFASENSAIIGNVCEGANYLGVCDRVTGEDSKSAISMAAAIRAIIKDEKSFFDQEYSCHSSNIQRWFYASVMRLPGIECRILITHYNITVRRKSTDQFNQYVFILQNIINSSTDLIFIKDLSRQVVLCNTAFARAMEKPLAEIYGRTDIERGCDPELAHGNQEKGIRGFEADDLDALNGLVVRNLGEPLRINSEIRYFDTIKIPFRNSRGEIVGLLGVSRDITERKHLEDRLRQSIKMEAIGRLSGGIAHDFNNILSSILGYAEVAKGKTTDESVAHALESVIGASLRARNLIKQILIFSRNGSTQLNPIDLKPIIFEVIDQIRPNVPRDVHVEPNIPQLECRVTGDASQLHQLLLNLLTNACQAMPEGGSLRIGLSIEKVESADTAIELEPGSYARLTVMDTGVGMSEAVRSRIFDPFYSTKGSKGTGLGLSVVHGIVKNHGGAIRVESNMGQGSTFTVWRPITNSSHSSSATMTSPAFERAGTILVIDDDDMLRSMISEMLQDMGFEVEAFPDPLEALSALTRNPTGYRILVSDYTMPSMNGLDAIDRAREITPDLPAILMTGHGDSLVYERSRNDFFLLAKPFKLSELESALSAVLSQK